MKSIDIFYKTYAADFKWLLCSLRSLDKYVTGYNRINIVVSNNEIEEMKRHVIIKFQHLPITVHGVSEYGSGYLFQQWCKINAPAYSSADFNFFADSDCIFDHPINLQDFIADDKPEILYTDYSKVESAIIWKKPTEDFIKEPVQYEFMRRNCLIYHRSTLEAIQKYEPNLEHNIMNSGRFSEFNAIGAYAWKFEQDKYNFVNTDNWEYVRPKAVQFHSYTQYEEMRKQFPEL